jgi:hypothetical protein
MKFTERQIRDFWAKVRVGVGDDCWVWTAATQVSGYGTKRVTRDGKHTMELAHRMSWLIFNSEIPDGLCVLHKCDNRLCVNPAHLFLGTHKDNTHDMMSKQRGNVAILTETQLEAVHALRAEGMSIRAIAKEMGCSTFPIMRALRAEMN